MESLINFDALGDAATTLINKLADGVGWIFNRETTQKTAVKTYVEDIQKSNLEPLTKAALISNARKAIKEYCNQHSILEVALQSLNSTAKPENVEDDWLNQFMGKARLVSDKEFQQIWGKILAEECNEANSIPKTLLHILEQMDKKDAMTFTALCSVTVYIEDNGRFFSPVVLFSHLDDFYSDIGITYDGLVELQALGLIEMDNNKVESAYITHSEIEPIIIYYDKFSFTLPQGINFFRNGNVIFTKAGQALCKAIDVDKQDGFWEEYCLPIWQRQIRE